MFLEWVLQAIPSFKGFRPRNHSCSSRERFIHLLSKLSPHIGTPNITIFEYSLVQHLRFYSSFLAVNTFFRPHLIAHLLLYHHSTHNLPLFSPLHILPCTQYTDISSFPYLHSEIQSNNCTTLTQISKNGTKNSKRFLPLHIHFIIFGSFLSCSQLYSNTPEYNTVTHTIVPILPHHVCRNFTQLHHFSIYLSAHHELNIYSIQEST